MNPDFLARLQSPPKSNRPIPFWSWNEKLRVEETRRQIQEMDNAGIGGYFMHARGGLQTEYMGREWMDNIQTGIEEARERGMGAWAYDENGWPSGFGDGRVNGLGEAFQQKYLRYEETAGRAGNEDPRTIYHLTLEDGRSLRFYYEVNPFYVDTLDKETTRRFLQEIYEPYGRIFGEELGKSMPGFFTDEPQVSRNGIPWSLTLPRAYQETYGEDLLPFLPHLFMETPGFERTRYRFWHLIQELFVTNFTQQIYEWCEKHRCQLTGHMVLEETLHSQITSNAAVMPHYEFFHMPGMDWLGRHIDPPTTPHQVASVAHQVGHKRVLSETFALTGWNVSFEELKWIYEWQMVRGVTHLCQHLEGYSLRGIRKRDYPPSLFYQQPWWKTYKLFNDAMSRIGMILSQGKVCFDVLVLHPQSSAWLRFNTHSNEGIDSLYDSFLELTHLLEGAHIPFHYGDERILQRHGKVEKNRFRVGEQSYSAVLVPPMEVLSHSTASLLETFAENGGEILWIQPQPRLIEGESRPMENLLKMGQRFKTAREAVRHISPSHKRVSVVNEEACEVQEIACTWREIPEHLAGEDCRFYFFVNSDRSEEKRTEITIPGSRTLLFRPEDGALIELPHTQKSKNVQVSHLFPPAGSLCLFATDRPEGLSQAGPRADLSQRHPLESELFQGRWNLELLEPNALTLDICDIWFDDQLQAEREHVSVVQSRALALERPVPLKLRFPFKVASLPKPPVYLVMESPEKFEIELNGQVIPPAPDNHAGYYRDISFRKIEISHALKEGDNDVVLRTRFQQSPSVYENLNRARLFEAEKNKLCYDTEIEAVYLVGYFGVNTPGTFEPLARHAMRYEGSFAIDTVPATVLLGDLTSQGLPFFNGSVKLSRTLKLGKEAAEGRLFKLKKKRAQVVSLAVNGQQAGQWLWPPYETDLQHLLVEGENLFEITLIGDLRNLLGPHHLEEGESYSVAPCCFFKEPNLWGNMPWDDRTCLVEFGVWL